MVEFEKVNGSRIQNRTEIIGGVGSIVFNNQERYRNIFRYASCANIRTVKKYDYDNLHIEIDNAASELKLDPWDALDIWHMGIEQWQNTQNK